MFHQRKLDVLFFLRGSQAPISKEWYLIWMIVYIIYIFIYIYNTFLFIFIIHFYLYLWIYIIGTGTQVNLGLIFDLVLEGSSLVVFTRLSLQGENYFIAPWTQSPRWWAMIFERCEECWEGLLFEHDFLGYQLVGSSLGIILPSYMGIVWS